MEEERISTQTFKKVACRKGLLARHLSFKPMLELGHIQTRYKFAKEYKNKDLRYWTHIYFADESCLELHLKDCKKRVRIGRAERYKVPYIAPAYSHRGGKLMFWGYVSWER